MFIRLQCQLIPLSPTIPTSYIDFCQRAPTISHILKSYYLFSCICNTSVLSDVADLSATPISYFICLFPITRYAMPDTRYCELLTYTYPNFSIIPIFLFSI